MTTRTVTVPLSALIALGLDKNAMVTIQVQEPEPQAPKPQKQPPVPQPSTGYIPKTNMKRRRKTPVGKDSKEQGRIDCCFESKVEETYNSGRALYGLYTCAICTEERRMTYTCKQRLAMKRHIEKEHAHLLLQKNAGGRPKRNVSAETEKSNTTEPNPPPHITPMGGQQPFTSFVINVGSAIMR